MRKEKNEGPEVRPEKGSNYTSTVFYKLLLRLINAAENSNILS